MSDDDPVVMPPTSRLRLLISGGLLALVVGALVDHGGHFGTEVPRAALLGVSLGAVLGLVRDGTPTGRVLGFGVGFVAGWAGFALRAGALPDIPLGRAVAAVVVIGVVTLVAAGSAGRLPLWAGLLGAGAMTGAYETAFAANPTAFVTDSMTAATTAILGVAVGFLVSVVVADWRANAPGAVSGPAGTKESAATPHRALWLPRQRNKEHPRVAQGSPASASSSVGAPTAQEH